MAYDSAEDLLEELGAHVASGKRVEIKLLPSGQVRVLVQQSAQEHPDRLTTHVGCESADVETALRKALERMRAHGIARYTGG